MSGWETGYLARFRGLLRHVSHFGVAKSQPQKKYIRFCNSLDATIKYLQIALRRLCSEAAMESTIERALVLAFPPSTYSMTVRAVLEGVALADDCIKNIPFLDVRTGRDLTGHLRRAGIVFRMHELCKEGHLPFESEMTKMPRANWHKQEMRSGKFIGHLVRTDSELAFPDDKPSRQDERLSNQGDFFSSPKIVPISEVLGSLSSLSAWLTYKLERSGRIEHLCWTVPACNIDEWLAHVNILKRAGSEVPVSALEAAATPDPRTSMRFREHISPALEDGDDTKTANDN